MTQALFPTFSRAPIAFERGEGARLFTAEGEDYLDFAAGIAVNSLGHCHPHLVETLQAQAAKLWHVSNLFEIPEQTRLAERLVALTFADRVFFANSGAEALECAIKTARRYHFVSGAPERYRFVTFEGAFHGRTMATIAAGGQEKYLEGFGPPLEGFDQVPFGSLEVVRQAIGPETAAILIEPVQGEGGLRPAEPSFLKGLRQLCDEHGILLVLDEVQCGIGRTGKLFAHEWAGIEPDVMAIAKGIGGGFPLGACLATEEAAKGMTPGTHGTTFGGNPLAMAVGNAVLDVVAAPGFLEHVTDIGLRLRQGLARLTDDYPDVVGEVRGSGLMLGLKTKVPNKDFVAALRDQHLIAVAAGDNVVRFLPPLIIGQAEVDEALDKAERACRALQSVSAAQGVA